MKNNVKQSDWYIGKYGTQSEVTATASVRVPSFSLSIPSEEVVVGTQAISENFLKDKLVEKGITLTEPTEQPTRRVRETRVKPEGKGFTASFAEVVKMKMSATESSIPFSRTNLFASKSKKFFATVKDNTPELDATNFEDFVATIMKLQKSDATKLIKNGKVTVNNSVVTDVNYALKSKDVVRGGLVGHFINNPECIAIVK